ncbi:hypothetical protein AURDEDRAFT_186916 [Auricularia subglabra TFB-10046 SS5]|nr:hypothetical protein AURDEDRAFT_186916 [Auricularia subglabra TFB-10046 SS5]
MPRLERLELWGIVQWNDFTGSDHRPRDVKSVATFQSLQVLCLSAASIPAHWQPGSALLSMIPFHQLRELWLLEGNTDSTCADLATLYPEMDSLAVVYCGFLPVGCLTSIEGHMPRRVVINKLPFAVSLSTWLVRYPPLTRLEIQEVYLNNDTMGAPPPLPVLTKLVVHLARCLDWHQRDWEFSGLILDADIGLWSLPALREVHVSAPQGEDDVEQRGCGYPLGSCRCRRPLSIALRDVAQWVRSGIAFDTEKLDLVSLDGVQVMDRDFCGAWNDMLEVAENIDVSEAMGTRSRFSTQSLDYHEQWRNVFWQ